MCYLDSDGYKKTGSRWQMHVCLVSSELSRQPYDIPFCIFSRQAAPQDTFYMK